jgi:hypothetical protein
MALSRMLFSNLSLEMLYNVKEQISAEIKTPNTNNGNKGRLWIIKGIIIGKKEG